MRARTTRSPRSSSSSAGCNPRRAADGDRLPRGCSGTTARPLLLHARAALLAGWRPLGLALRRRVGAFVCAVLVAFVFVRVAQDSIGLMHLFPRRPGRPGRRGRHRRTTSAGVPPARPLEFGALLLPMLAAARREARGRIRFVLRALPVSVALLALAAAVELWVSSHLFMVLIRGGYS